MTAIRSRPPDRIMSRVLASVLLPLLLIPVGKLRADSEQDFLLFVSLEAFDESSSDNPKLDDSGFSPAVDMLYTFSGDRFRVLGEFFNSRDENDLERLQVGWQAGEQTVIWLGRFHQPGKYWSTEYHHGQLMQTTISQPGVEQWEDDGGPIPSHVTGVLMESEFVRDDSSGFELALSAGLAPKLAIEGLQPLDLLDPESGHRTAANFRFAYRPDILSENRVGLLGGWSDINVDGDTQAAFDGLSAIKQTTLSVYADWRWDKWRLISSVTHFSNDLELPGTTDTGRFLSGYLQAEYSIDSDWTLFARIENSDDEEKSAFLSLLPEFVTRQDVLGVRWDIATKHSLTLELSDTSVHAEDAGNDHSNAIRLQWSTVFP